MNERLPKFKGKKLVDQIGKFSAGLTYISETDAPVEPFYVANRSQKDFVDSIAGTKQRETREADEFFERLTAIKDWFGPRERERANRFASICKLLTENLHELTVVRIGRVEIDIYVVGIDSDDDLIGIKTKAVET